MQARFVGREHLPKAHFPKVAGRLRCWLALALVMLVLGLLALLVRLWQAGWQRVALARAGAQVLLFVRQGVARLLAQL